MAASSHAESSKDFALKLRNASLELQQSDPPPRPSACDILLPAFKAFAQNYRMHDVPVRAAIAEVMRTNPPIGAKKIREVRPSDDNCRDRLFWLRRQVTTFKKLNETDRAFCIRLLDSLAAALNPELAPEVREKAA
ncbi:MAG: hypothetical protein JO019_03225 [Candidatus Kaiserbacteria bacterium]|nr:hypothetical protein [Candidatus Kaiserbacteria bacterium]